MYAIAVLLIFQLISTTRTFPAYMKRYLDGRGVKDCWFVYFGEEVIDFSYYGIPRKPLPTPDAMWTGEFAEAPPAIDGPVLINAGCLSGWESGPGVLNPYEQLKSLQPPAVIDYGAFVFDGHFQIPLAASLTHSHKAQQLLAASQLPEALASPRRGPASLGPRSQRGRTQCATRRHLTS